MTLAAGVLKKNMQYSENFDKIVGAENAILSDPSMHFFFNTLAVINMEVLYGSSALDT